MSFDALPERIKQLEEEVALLRRVHESARSLLRFNGIDGVRIAAAVRDLDEAIEKVKEFDGGTFEELELPRMPMSIRQIEYMHSNQSLVDFCEDYEGFATIVRAVEAYHGIGVAQKNKPSTEYVGNGMFKGEKLSEALEAWALRQHNRGEEMLSQLLSYAAVFVAQREPNESLQFRWRMYMLCDAYESGIGHGIKRDGHDNADNSLYADIECNMAYRIGYKHGDRKRDWEERREARETPKPFKSEWGKWFPTSLLGHPMREYAPGKWEHASWPSEQERPTDREILEWLHSVHSHLPDGSEYGIYRLRWLNNGAGSTAQVEQTLADFSDIKRAMKASASQQPS